MEDYKLRRHRIGEAETNEKKKTVNVLPFLPNKRYAKKINIIYLHSIELRVDIRFFHLILPDFLWQLRGQPLPPFFFSELSLCMSIADAAGYCNVMPRVCASLCEGLANRHQELSQKSDDVSDISDVSQFRPVIL